VFRPPNLQKSRSPNCKTTAGATLCPEYPEME
jgi:hypothetical protein